MKRNSLRVCLVIGLLWTMVGVGGPVVLAGDAEVAKSGAEVGGGVPNVVLILCDDLGMGDLACYGNPIVKTPNLDRLAASGIRFSQYHCPEPICGPSRVALLTGRYDQRSGYRMAHESKNSSLDEPWLMRQLRDNGYVTGAFGKWHIGNMGFRARGCDEWTITAPGGWSDYYAYPVYRNSEKRQKSDGTYATDFLTEEAIQFIGRHADVSGRKPFFLYLAYTAPHFPLQAPEEEIAPYRGKGLTPGAEIVYGMVTRMDKGVGRLLAALQKEGVLENTLVIFTSDNGPVMGSYKGMSERRYNCDLAGEKEYMLEGGIRVPCLASWPKAFGKSGRLFQDPMHGVDWAPTILAAAGVNPSGKPLDGVSFLAALEGKAAAPSLVRFWCYNKAYMTSASNAAMREGDWKIYRPRVESLNRWDNAGRVPKEPATEPWKLFNLASDPLEKNNLAGQDPERVQHMVTQFDSWWAEVLAENVQHSGRAKPEDPAPKSPQ